MVFPPSLAIRFLAKLKKHYLSGPGFEGLIFRPPSVHPWMDGWVLKIWINNIWFTDPYNHTYSESSWLSTDAPVMSMKNTHAETKTMTMAMTKTKWLKDPTCAILFLKIQMIWLNYIKYADGGWTSDASLKVMHRRWWCTKERFVMHQRWWCADALILLMHWCCWYANATESGSGPICSS